MHIPTPPHWTVSSGRSSTIFVLFSVTSRKLRTMPVCSNKEQMGFWRGWSKLARHDDKGLNPGRASQYREVKIEKYIGRSWWWNGHVHFLGVFSQCFWFPAPTPERWLGKRIWSRVKLVLLFTELWHSWEGNVADSGWEFRRNFPRDS